jgi:hypothetical protein
MQLKTETPESANPRGSRTGLTFTIRRLAKIEHWGDWHDKPLKWVADCAEDAMWTQKFSTKQDALAWRCCARRVTRRTGAQWTTGNFNAVQDAFQAI